MVSRFILMILTASMCPTTIQGAAVDIPREAQTEDRQFPGLPDPNSLPSLMPPMALIQQLCAQINDCKLPEGFFSSIPSVNQLVPSMGSDGSAPVENPMRAGRYEIPSVNQRPYSQEFIASPNAPATMAPYVPPPIMSPYSGPAAPLPYAATPAAYQYGPQPQVTLAPYDVPVTTPAPYQQAIPAYPYANAQAAPMATTPNSNNSYLPSAASSYQYRTTTKAPYAPAAIAPYASPVTAAPYAVPPTPATYLRPPSQAAYQPAPQPPMPSAPYAAPAITFAPVPYHPAVSVPAYPSVNAPAYPSASASAVPMTSNSYNIYSPSAAPSYQYPTTTVAPPNTPSYYENPTTTVAASPTYPYPSTTVASPSTYPARPAQSAHTYSYAFLPPNQYMN